jgi:hypothetical protein
VIRLFALPTACLVATIGYGAVLLGSDVPNAQTSPIAWAADPGSFVGATSARCLLVPDHDCDEIQFDGAPMIGKRHPPQPPVLVFQGVPSLPVINPYSGTFVNFPLR